MSPICHRSMLVQCLFSTSAGNAKQVTFQQLWELLTDAGECRPPGEGWMPASRTGPRGPLAAAAPEKRKQAF